MTERTETKTILEFLADNPNGMSQRHGSVAGVYTARSSIVFVRGSPSSATIPRQVRIISPRLTNGWKDLSLPIPAQRSTGVIHGLVTGWPGFSI